MVAFAIASLILAALGVYGVLAFTVAERTREIGIRTALGAGTARTIRDIVFQGVRLSAVGVALGALGSVLLEPVLASMLVGISAVDFRAVAAASGLLVLVSAAASILPARRAARVDPLTALRQE